VAEGGRPRDPADPLDGVRPGGRRSWWLRQAFAAEPEELGAWIAAPPLSGPSHADVAVLGGGYTGLWTAIRLTQLEPGIRVVIVENDVCGGGASGRNGGFVTGWWDELPGLIKLAGDAEAIRTAKALDQSIVDLRKFCAQHGINAWWTEEGFVSVSAAPSQDDAWREATDACERLGYGDRWRPMSHDEVASHARSPVFREGAFMPLAATVQPGTLARGLRRVALERGVIIHERTRALESMKGRGPHGHGEETIRTFSTAGEGLVTARHVVVALNAWAAAWPAFGRRIVTWSSYMVLTEPIPKLLEEIGWTGGAGIADSRFTLHYARTTPDGRIALGGGGGRAGFGGRIGAAFSADEGAARRAADGLRRWFPQLDGVRIEDAWGGPIDIDDSHRPWFGSLPGGRIHFGLGYSGNGVAASVLGGRILASLALGRKDDFTSLPIVGDRATPRAFPPEPLRYLGARTIRAAITRRERAEEAGRRPNRVVREVSRLPRRLGYHIGPD
jgi:glycine/D-amino acid oxidase-like deaminating enzyme